MIFHSHSPDMLHHRWASCRDDGHLLALYSRAPYPAGLLFLGSHGGNSQLLELSVEAASQSVMLNEALVDSLAPIHDVLMYEDPQGRL